MADVILVAASGIFEKSLAASSAQLIFALSNPGTERVEFEFVAIRDWVFKEPIGMEAVVVATVWASIMRLALEPTRTRKMKITIKMGLVKTHLVCFFVRPYCES